MNSEWEELFEYRGTAQIILDNLAIGSLIHYRLSKMQQNNNEMLFLLIQLIDDWLFYTMAEMTLLALYNTSGIDVRPRLEEEMKAIIADLHFEVVAEEDDDVKSAGVTGNRPIIVNGDMVDHKETIIDKNFAPMTGNHNGGIILQSNNKELTDGSKW